VLIDSVVRLLQARRGLSAFFPVHALMVVDLRRFRLVSAGLSDFWQGPPSQPLPYDSTYVTVGHRSITLGRATRLQRCRTAAAGSSFIVCAGCLLPATRIQGRPSANIVLHSELNCVQTHATHDSPPPPSERAFWTGWA